MKKFYLFMVVFLSVGLCLLLWLFLPALSSKKVLRVMTYSSFVGVFGPGLQIQEEFEKVCDCRVKWIKVPDSTLFVQRLSLRKDGFKTDVVMGFDQLSLKAAKTLKWQEVQMSKGAFFSPAKDFLSKHFVPYDWSPMSFISRKKMDKISLNSLLEEKYKNNISLPSPRTSTVGSQFYYWIWLVFKEKTDVFLKMFKNQLYGLSPSWSTSYALFQRGHVDLSFSYLSSLLYHQEQNQKDFYFVPFEEGHPYQVELAAVSDFCTQCDLAHSFIYFLLKPDTQSLLKKRNYMFPAVISPDTRFEMKSFPKVDLIQYDQLDSFLDRKEEWLDKWDKLMK